MEHSFNITTSAGTDRQGHDLRSGITVFLAETNLDPSPQLGTPETIAGNLAISPSPKQLTKDQLFQFKFKPDVEVGFEGRGYRFSKLERDGTFELSLIR